MVTTNKLTERVLARYVGTGVKIKYRDSDRIYTLGSVEFGIAVSAGLENVQLNLRPLSDLTKPCLEGGKVPIEELLALRYKRLGFNVYTGKTTISVSGTKVLLHDTNSNVLLEIDTSDLGGNSYRTIEQLHLWHFDTGLDKDLWIDINELEVGE